MTSKKTYTKEDFLKYYDSWREVYKDKRLKGSDWPILLTLKDTGFDEIFMTQQHIGERVEVTRQTANRSLVNLEKCGYIIGNHPPRGTKKAVTFRLAPNLVPPAKYIFFMSANEDMNMYQSEDMKTKKAEPVMSQVTDTIVSIKGNNIKGYPKLALGEASKLTSNTKQHMGTGQVMTPKSKLPQTTPYYSVSYEPLLELAKKNEHYHPAYDIGERVNYDSIEKSWINECLKKMTPDELTTKIDDSEREWSFMTIANYEEKLSKNFKC